MAYIQTTVDMDLSDFDEQDIIEFLEDQGYCVVESNNTIVKEQIEDLYEAYRFDRPAFEKMICNLFLVKLGRIVP
jgi:hypothetical protein